MKPIEGMLTTPHGLDDCPEIFGPAWYGCLLWAASKPEIVAAFEKESGLLFDALESQGLNRLIDEATGRTRETVVAFADYVTLNYWGEDELNQ